jgi:hypothetical protein
MTACGTKLPNRDVRPNGREPNKCASLAIRKPCCRLWSSKLNSASFGQNLNEEPLKRAQAK